MLSQLFDSALEQQTCHAAKPAPFPLKACFSKKRWREKVFRRRKPEGNGGNPAITVVGRLPQYQTGEGPEARVAALRHENLVTFAGSMTSDRGRAFVLYEQQQNNERDFHCFFRLKEEKANKNDYEKNLEKLGWQCAMPAG